MEIACPYCGRQLRSAEDVAGREVQCAGCGTAFTEQGAEVPVEAPRFARRPRRDSADDYFATSPAVGPLPPLAPDRSDEDDIPEDEIRPSRRPMRWRPSAGVAEAKVRGPAIGLMVYAGIG